ncbi:hypothetical protein Agabi119p4_3093 [Agaricus bisporus var. burnettii]|uniref:Uncharacterized protein n=1 Tax=Agaricus bisporus var. burnettii TaxID=192524 RepID=A0A8H7KIU1_AGABI|nr:hypothetical protein Agabi119p4_3093 [Agaricus bisporus var. burnettii]
MCRWRQVKHRYTLCQHMIGEPDKLIECEDRFCKFSPNHPRDCGPGCANTCWQYRQFPQQYDITHQGRCPNCVSNGPGAEQVDATSGKTKKDNQS